MAVLEREILSEPASDGPKPYCWTRAKYDEAITLGLFGPNDRIELLQGMIVQKMPQNSRHSTALTLTYDVLRALFPVGYVVRGQMPLILDDLSQPEPDVAVVREAVRDYNEVQPAARDAVLVIAISDSTLATDRKTKAAFYAQAMIPEYWIVNLDARVVEVHRQPGASDDLSVIAYRDVTRVSEAETISPLALTDASIAVSDLLP